MPIFTNRPMTDTESLAYPGTGAMSILHIARVVSRGEREERV
jgi:hypothetical protein